MEQRADGLVRITLKKAYTDGTIAVDMDPLSLLMARFDALVTGASDKGTRVRIFQPVVEGKLLRGFQGLDVGDPVRVELVHTDVERGFIDFVRQPRG